MESTIVESKMKYYEPIYDELTKRYKVKINNGSFLNGSFVTYLDAEKARDSYLKKLEIADRYQRKRKKKGK